MSKNPLEYDKNLVKEAVITPGLFRPNYNRCIHMVLPTALSFLGLRLPSEKYAALSDTKSLRKTMEDSSCFDAEKVIMIVADSVGLGQFQKSDYLAKIYKRFDGFQLSSVFPTITSTALSSIHLAATPGVHGIFGHKIFFKELGAVVDTLKMSTLTYGARDALVRVGIDVRALIYCPSPYDLVEEQGIEHIELLENEIAGTGLSNMIYRKQVARGFSNLIDAFSTAKRILEQEDGKRVIMNIYTGILDSLSHKYGPYSEEYAIGLRFLEENIERLVRSIKDDVAKKTTFLFLSDHGQDPIDPKLEVSFSKSEISELGKFMRAPIGKSGRVLHFYSKKDCNEKLMKALRDKIGERGYLITFEEAVRNLVGRTTNLEMSRLRLGDILVVLKAGVNAEIKKDELQDRWEEQFFGSHGSTTLNELTVPFITARMSLLKEH
jgi:predicted AlkP superfamily pyrophosphatase or phosphodiesterase